MGTSVTPLPAVQSWSASNARRTGRAGCRTTPTWRIPGAYLRERLAGARRLRAPGRVRREFADAVLTARSYAGNHKQHIDAGQELLAFSAAEAVGKTPYDIFSKDRADNQTSIDHEVIATKAPVQRGGLALF